MSAGSRARRAARRPGPKRPPTACRSSLRAPRRWLRRRLDRDEQVGAHLSRDLVAAPQHEIAVVLPGHRDANPAGLATAVADLAARWRVRRPSPAVAVTRARRDRARHAPHRSRPAGGPCAPTCAAYGELACRVRAHRAEWSPKHGRRRWSARGSRRAGVAGRSLPPCTTPRWRSVDDAGSSASVSERPSAAKSAAGHDRGGIEIGPRGACRLGAVALRQSDALRGTDLAAADREHRLRPRRCAAVCPAGRPMRPRLPRRSAARSRARRRRSR